jgi:hypothetical protein
MNPLTVASTMASPGASSSSPPTEASKKFECECGEAFATEKVSLFEYKSEHVFMI